MKRKVKLQDFRSKSGPGDFTNIMVFLLTLASLPKFNGSDAWSYWKRRQRYCIFMYSERLDVCNEDCWYDGTAVHKGVTASYALAGHIWGTASISIVRDQVVGKTTLSPEYSSVFNVDYTPLELTKEGFCFMSKMTKSYACLWLDIRALLLTAFTRGKRTLNTLIRLRLPESWLILYEESSSCTHIR